MKTNQLLGVIGGALLAISVFIPMHGMMMIQAIQLISFSLLIGLMPVVLLGCGIVGALMAKQGKSLITLLCGAFALVFMLIASDFHIAAMFQDLLGIMVLAGCALLIASGAMGMKASN